MNESQILRSQSAERQRDSSGLRNACLEAGQACRATIERSKARRLLRVKSEIERLDIASLIANALSRRGLPAFVFESSPDTAFKS
jgi:hypothetical protein